MHKIFRIFIILFLALSATIVVGQSCYNQPTYASMGSTGGGSTSTGGGSSSGGGWSSSDSDSDADFFDLHSWGVILLIFLVLGGLVYLEMLFSRFRYWLRKIHYAYHLKRQRLYTFST